MPTKPITKVITCADIVYLDLFDDIPYKWTRRYHLNEYDDTIDREDDDDFVFEVVIRHLPCKRVNCATVEFTFDLDRDERYSCNDETRYQKYGIKDPSKYGWKTFTKIATYKKNSSFDIVLQEVLEYETEKEEEARIKRDDKLEVLSFKIAIDKIKRSKIYNFGLGLKINMRDAGITD